MTLKVDNMIQSKLLVKGTDVTGEAATWLKDRGWLLWVDIDNGILHQYEDRSGKTTDRYLPDMVTSIIPINNQPGVVILAMKSRMVVYSLDDQSFRTLCDFRDIHPQWRTNDCKCSPDGRIWCGMMNMKHQDQNGFVYWVDREGKVTKILDHQCIPNGVVWTPQGDRLYYADSGRSCIEEYAYDSHTGNIQFLRTAVTVPPEYGIPDGMTIDARGNLWVAHWGGSGVYVWNPDNGELLDQVAVPVPNPASCTFGGEGNHQLFITTARDGLTEAELKSYPLSGSLFVADVPQVKGGENHYAFRL